MKEPLYQRALAWLRGGFLGAVVLYAVWPWLPYVHGGARPRTIVFYGFSSLGEAFQESIFPAFARRWQAQTGERVEFISAFGGSGTITNQIIMGVPAQVALLSLELDAERLARAKVIAPGSWRALPHGGVVNRTPFVILVRPGNPLRIRDFADLTRPGVRVVHPDPLTSGAATWALLAEYGAAVRSDRRNPRAGHDLLLGLWRNVVAQSSSARGARTQFDNGFGDALVTYEQELLYDQARGRLHGEIVYPRSTVLSEHTLVLVPQRTKAADRPLVRAFVDFVFSEHAQRLFVEHGFRSVLPELDQSRRPPFVAIADPFGARDYGGWPHIKREIVDTLWRQQVLKELGR
ncbi:MAG: substrate-binding domain-containing protein [Deltaproteobacteria bacterium]|nr:substrate-binding domain-containing protein [Deltaproteobacteria bacterium]